MQRVYTPNNQGKKGPGRIAWWIVIATVVAILLGTLSLLLLLIPFTSTTEFEPTRAVVAGVPTQETRLPPTETATETAVVASPSAVAPGTDTPAPAATATLPLPTATQIPPQSSPTQQPVIQPTATVLPATAVPTAISTNWRAEYFNNPNLVGTPVLVRDDANLAFDWGGSSPVPGVPADNFSVRWTRTLAFDEGAYRFHALVDDGIRLYVDGTLVLNEWRDGNQREVTADRQLSAGSHQIRVEYYEHSGDARVRLWWEKLNPAHYPQWKGEYWANRQLSGTPALVRNDVNLDFNWGRGAPAAGLPADDFSARWTRTLHFEDGRYRFHALVDDGMRLYVDGALLIDQWRDGSQREVTADVNLSRGNHVVRVDYYEHGGDARIRAWWERIGTIGYPEWKGEYWNNREFKGNPVLVRNDARIDFNWGLSAPDPVLPADDFAVRWSRNLNFEAGVYRFYAVVDDGIRLYVAGSRILDRWHDSSADRPYQADIALSAGTHPVVVEYYEHQFGAEVEVWWERIGNLPPTTTATSSPSVTSSPTTVPTATPTKPATTVPTTTATSSPSVTSSPTTVPTATATPSPTTGPTSSPTPTATATATTSPTPTATVPPPTATASPTASPTPSPSPIPDASITLKPNGGSANTQVTVTGQGFPAETAVHIYLGRRGDAPYQAARATGLSNRNGKINIVFIMPANWPDGDAIVEDVVVVHATAAGSEASASANFAYGRAAEPGLSLSPNQGNAGTRVTATGSGFPAGAHVNLYLRTPDDGGDGASYGEATANNKGNFVIAFTVPSTWSDGSPITGETLRVVAATDDNSVRARSVFTLLTAVWEQSGYFAQ